MGSTTNTKTVSVSGPPLIGLAAVCVTLLFVPPPSGVAQPATGLDRSLRPVLGRFHPDRPAAELAGYKEGLWALAFSPDGRTLAAADRRTVRLWEVATRGQRAAYTDPSDPPAHRTHGLAFSPDGRTLAVAHR